MKVSALNKELGADADECLIGTSLRDQIYGYGGNDKLYGMAGDDILYGGTGNDVVDGGTGADIMYGGAGDDLYRVDNLADVVSAQTVAGTDDGVIVTGGRSLDHTLHRFLMQL